MNHTYKQVKIVITAVMFFTAVACKKNNEAEVVKPEEKMGADGFNYVTTKDVALNLRLLSNNNEPIVGAKINLYAPGRTELNQSLFTAVSDANGYVRSTVTIPSFLDTLLVDPAYIGLMRYAKAFISGNSINAVIGGATGSSGNIVPTSRIAGTYMPTIYPTNNFRSVSGTVYSYMGTYDSWGRPNYLDPVADVITAGFLSRLNASLPEASDLPSRSPSFFHPNVNLNVHVTQTADVWITFVSEGAGFRNALGYFKYPTNNPPANAAAIDTVFYVFPNSSLVNSSGNLRSGDRVKIGRFNAGTSIGFVLVADGFNGTAVNSNNTKYYSTQSYNSITESNSSKRQHGVQLYDATEQLLVFGFEDLNRTNGSSDEDFNDLVFYTKANPVTAININNIPPVNVPTDTDGDGVPNNVDAFPTNPALAYVYHYPSATGFNTVGYEDLWPNRGDFDFNDMLVRQRFTFYANSQNNVVNFDGIVALGAAGANFRNAYAIELPVAASTISSVTGTRNSSGFFSIASNGTEIAPAGSTDNAILPVFDNHNSILNDPSGNIFVNTLMDRDRFVSDTVRLAVRFSTPQPVASLAGSRFDPFLISNQRRGVEVHLPGFAPTSRADRSLLGTADDRSSVATNTWYRSAGNAPWALSFIDNFTYPREQANITQAYLNFSAWALSGGVSFADWYTNTSSSYRNTNLLYTR